MNNPNLKKKKKPVLFFAVLGTPAMCATKRIVPVALIFYVTRHRNAEKCIFSELLKYVGVSLFSCFQFKLSFPKCFIPDAVVIS